MTHAPISAHVRLANEIAVQFRHRDPATAAEEIAAHIRAFWDPRMRARLIADAETGNSELDPLIVSVAALLPPPVVRVSE
ncbi:formate dehydrogenase subunit delta [Streptomyces sp. V1I1]|jgi:formate dehydrogenase subunit delta|uniref:formate dehydrogenase subunit delta n=1 Tax=Streptomyces sp. V1I1 TaxID=3042272 RepID=UPI00277EE719|nr:formate dehydrogenase subunit delta [Streptomyces sp. V1I1]MDQ0945294.1 formate dehydrogenase subunit delta [Streptomyces sp. V1I1]